MAPYGRIRRSSFYGGMAQFEGFDPDGQRKKKQMETLSKFKTECMETIDETKTKVALIEEEKKEPLVVTESFRFLATPTANDTSRSSSSSSSELEEILFRFDI